MLLVFFWPKIIATFYEIFTRRLFILLESIPFMLSFDRFKIWRRFGNAFHETIQMYIFVCCEEFPQSLKIAGDFRNSVLAILVCIVLEYL